MSDDWLKGRDLRGRKQAPDEDDALPQQPGHLHHHTPRHFPPGFEAELRTATGEFMPLTDEVIAEVDALLKAHERGEAPEGFEPAYKEPGGDTTPLTRETFEALVGAAGGRTWHETGPHEATSRDDPAPVHIRPLPDEARPTPDDVVDAEWVIEVGKGLLAHQRRTAPPPAAPAEEDDRPIFVEVEPHPVRNALVMLLAAVLALAAFLPSPHDRSAGSSIPIGPPAVPAASSVEPTSAPAAAAAAPTTPTASPEPTATLAPYQQGQIAFASDRDGDFDVYVLNLATRIVTRLTESEAADRWPAWSPDGSQIVFVSDRMGDDDLFLMNTDGSGVEQITTNIGLDRAPAWSPDGSQIVFTRESVDGGDMMLLDADCLDEPDTCEDTVQALTAERYDLDPAWSPDGDTLAFTAADFPGLPSAIAYYTPRTRNFSLLTGTGSTDFDPAWSPDGAWLAFVSNRYGDYDVWLVGTQNGLLVQATRSTGTDVQPTWSPDGQFLVFASDRDGGAFELYLMDATCALRGGAPQPAGTPTSPGEPTATPSISQCEQDALRLTESVADDLDPAWTGVTAP